MVEKKIGQSWGSHFLGCLIISSAEAAAPSLCSFNLTVAQSALNGRVTLTLFQIQSEEEKEELRQEH